MDSLTPQETAYLLDHRGLARIATADRDGMPHVTPVADWSFDEASNTIEVRGDGMEKTKKFRNVAANPRAAIVIDELAATVPRHRAVMVQGAAEAIATEGGVIRIHTDHVVSWGIE